MKQLIADEEFVSIQEAQAGLTRVFKRAERKGRIIRIMRNNKPLGVLIPNTVWIKFVKLFEGLST